MMVAGESVSRRACTETPSTSTLAVRVGPYRGQFKSGNDAKLEESVAKPSGTERQGQSDIKCYTCGVLVTSRNCSKNRRTGSEEACGKPMRNPPNRLGTQVAALVREQELQVEQDGREQQTCDTKRQERELKGTLDRVAATMHGLSPTKPEAHN